MYAIYARQSVDRPDSISIDSQIEFCVHETRGGSYKVYEDRGYSGKNTDRPMFQQLVKDIKKGNVSSVIVYKLDRISRSILDFSNMMELFQQYKVEFISSTEKFDTSTPMGKAMLNICIVFAQLERETIQKRVSDAYISRSHKGFYMGGIAPYGYNLVSTAIEGKKTAMYAINPEEAEHVKTVFEIYQDPTASFSDILKHFEKHGILCRDKKWHTSRLSDMFRIPAYVKADEAIYDFFESQGATIINDRTDFIGSNGCYFYNAQEATAPKRKLIKGNTLVLAPHEGIVTSDIWLKCRIKCINNNKIQTGRKITSTWLAGKLKCAKCGYALVKKTFKGKLYSYYHCSYKLQARGCEGCGYIPASQLEDSIFQEIKTKLLEFGTMTSGIEKNLNPRLSILQDKLEKVEKEITNLVNSINHANKTLMDYINKKILVFDQQKQELLEDIAKESADSIDTEQILQMGELVNKWDEITLDDKRLICNSLIQTIRVSAEKTEILWKF